MAEIKVVAERTIAAPPKRVYDSIADYKRHRVRWLTPAFSECVVESGGRGTGSVFRYHFKAGPRERDYRMEATEVKRGSILREMDTESSLVTTWSVVPEGKGSRVRIETTWQGSSGIGGFMERAFAPRTLRGVYEAVLENLDRYVRA